MLGKIVEKKVAMIFYVITFILSFILLPLHFIFKSVGDYSVSFTQLAPAIAVILISIILMDKTILSGIGNHLKIHKTKISWIIVSITIPAICIMTSSIIMTLLGNTYIPWKGNVIFYILNIVAMLMGCFSEEIGWRGFLLPHLQKKYSQFVSGIIVGVLWGVWHLNFMGGIIGFILYTITIIEMSTLMTWLYNKTGGNLLLMIIWHSTFNIVSHIFLWERFGIYLFAVESIVFGITCACILKFNNKNY